MTTVGTSYFVSKKLARKYYEPYEGYNTNRAVDSKIAEGLIHIGKPPLTMGQTLRVVDGRTRYAIVDRD